MRNIHPWHRSFGGAGPHTLAGNSHITGFCYII